MSENNNTGKRSVDDHFINPFKGPDSYNETDTLYFYGRDAERNDLINLIEQNTLTLMYARSGIGKSSLINAGLIPVMKKSVFYFPVLIRLSDEMIVNGSKSFSHAVVNIIKDEAKKRKVRISIANDSRVIVRDAPSLTEFLYFSEFISEANDKVVPVIIFDQFEEIFSRHFRKANIRDLIDDLSYVMESRIPQDESTDGTKKEAEASDNIKIFGDELFKNYNEIEKSEELLSLRNSLGQNLKEFRFVFSFRDEYLPRFESLVNKLPSIFKMSGRLNLQTFSISLATKVINRISKSSIELDLKLCEHLARIISSSDKKFESQYFTITEEVQPFLLSLVCRKIYSEIAGTNTNDKIIDLIKKEDSQIVDDIISEYTEEIFSKVSQKTRKFVEEELITENERRKLFVLSDVQDKEILEDLNDLSKEQELRYLNIVQYFNSSNVEILHDRLLRPLVKSRRVRREREIAKTLEEQERKLKEQNEAEKKKVKKKRALTLGFVAGLLFVAGAILLINLKSFDTFLSAENDIRIKNLSSEIPKNSIGAFMNILNYKKSIDTIGNLVGVDVLPHKLDPLSFTKDNLNENIIKHFKNTPLFVSDSDTLKGIVSSLYNYKCRIYDSIGSYIYQIVKLDSSFSGYNSISRIARNKPIDENVYFPTVLFSDDDKFFMIHQKDSLFLYKLENTNGNEAAVFYESFGGIEMDEISDLNFSVDSERSLLIVNTRNGIVTNYWYSPASGQLTNQHLLNGGDNSYLRVFADKNNNIVSYEQRTIEEVIRDGDDALTADKGEDNGTESKTNDSEIFYLHNFYDRNSSAPFNQEIKGSTDFIFIGTNYFVTKYKNSLKILDILDRQVYSIDTRLSESLFLNSVNSRNLFSVSDRFGNIEIYDAGARESEKSLDFSGSYTITAAPTVYAFGSETDNKILIGYNNVIRIFDLQNEIEHSFGSLEMDLKYGQFNSDNTVSLFDTKGNLIKWYYEMGTPEESKLNDYFSFFKRIYGEKSNDYSFSKIFYEGPENTKSMLIGTVIGFIENLGKRNFTSAYSKLGSKNWGSFEQFSSMDSYGGIDSTWINTATLKFVNSDSASVFVDYFSSDPHNQNGIYKQYFILHPDTAGWKIVRIDNLDKKQWYK